ncbi:MAG: hypothetical protein ACXVOI_00145 [Tumebacillaceae bacterium]
MREEYRTMSTVELERAAQQLLQEENAVMKELLRRGWGRDAPNTLEHADMKPNEEDF